MRRKNPKTPKSSSPPTTDPFPDHPSPTPHQCRSLRDSLLISDGFPEQFASFRRNRSVADPEEPEQTVLDGLVSTVLSQNTTEANSSKAFALLKSAFPTWQDVLIAESRSVENAIRCGGLAPTKTTRIKSILKDLMVRRGCLCLEYLRELSVDEVKAELSRFKGIGPKTVACLLMFNLQKDDFPVDTHVLRIARAIGWVPAKADRTKTYHHLNKRIPDELKFELNCLLYTHGKSCQLCNKNRGTHSSSPTNAICPVSNNCLEIKQEK